MSVFEHDVDFWRGVSLECIYASGRLTENTVSTSKSSQVSTAGLLAALCVSGLLSDLLKSKASGSQAHHFSLPATFVIGFFCCVLDFYGNLFRGPDVMLGAPAQKTPFFLLCWVLISYRPTCRGIRKRSKLQRSITRK